MSSAFLLRHPEILSGWMLDAAGKRLQAAASAI
jgi:hypothetical protein